MSGVCTLKNLKDHIRTYYLGNFQVEYEMRAKVFKSSPEKVSSHILGVHINTCLKVIKIQSNQLLLKV